MAAKNKEAPQAKGKEGEVEEYKYGIAELEEATGLKPASIRVALRNSGLPKPGRRWGWNSKSEFNDVVKTLKARAEKAPASTSKGKAADKPAEKKAKKAKKGADAE